MESGKRKRGMKKRTSLSFQWRRLVVRTEECLCVLVCVLCGWCVREGGIKDAQLRSNSSREGFKFRILIDKDLSL
jgi:hypothetical protein